MVEAVAGKSRSGSPSREANKELRSYGTGVHHGVRVDENGVSHTISGPLGSTFTEKPPVWTRPSAAKSAVTVELENAGPYTLTPEEVYVLAFGLCMVNRLSSTGVEEVGEDEEELKGMGLRLTNEEFRYVHRFIESKPGQFDLITVAAQIRGKLIDLINEDKREDVLSQNDPQVARWLLGRFAGFKDQEDLDQSLTFMFQPLEELGMGKYFRGENGVSPKSE